MKLTQNELKLVSETISSQRRSRIFNSLHLAVLAIVLVSLYSGRIVTEGPAWLMPIVLILLIAHVAHLRRSASNAEKLADILSRYVNRDPEAITQLSGNPDAE